MKTGVLLINLGTPDSPTTKGIRAFYKEFFSDKRVFDIPALGLWALRNLIILPFRAPKTAKLYQEIWTEKGSPLMVYSNELNNKVQTLLGENFIVELGMGYGKPGIKNAIENLQNSNVKKIIVIPLFPQYASSTIGSVSEAVLTTLSKYEIIPPIELIHSYYNHPKFINAWVTIANNYELKNYDHILFSYHGIPERHIQKSSCNNYCLNPGCCSTINEKNQFCYKAQCYATTKGIANTLGLTESQYTIAFQSRFGKDPWIQPYLDEIIIEQAKKGNKKLLVFSPSFVADCLETIHEIGVEYNELFTENGGEKLQLVESLNSNDVWADCIAELVLK